MKIGSMLGDIVGSLFKKPVTEMYPFERNAAPENYRGKLHYNPATCTGCMLCVRDCPAEALELIVLDKVNKRFVMRYNLDNCTFCDQCVKSCRSKSLELANDEWELAALSREPFTIYYGRDEDVEFLLEKHSQPGAEGAT